LEEETCDEETCIGVDCENENDHEEAGESAVFLLLLGQEAVAVEGH